MRYVINKRRLTDSKRERKGITQTGKELSCANPVVNTVCFAPTFADHVLISHDLLRGNRTLCSEEIETLELELNSFPVFVIPFLSLFINRLLFFTYLIFFSEFRTQ